MSQLSNEEIYQEVGKIVANFDLYKCDECATAVMPWLKENGISGRIIKIQTALRELGVEATKEEMDFYREFQPWVQKNIMCPLLILGQR